MVGSAYRAGDLLYGYHRATPRARDRKQCPIHLLWDCRTALSRAFSSRRAASGQYREDRPTSAASPTRQRQADGDGPIEWVLLRCVRSRLAPRVTSLRCQSSDASGGGADMPRSPAPRQSDATGPDSDIKAALANG